MPIGTRNGFVVEGDWVWRLKDWIDRRFMRRYNELPEMAAAVHPPASGIADAEALKEISAIAMRCGGCGAKVGATVLSRALGSIEPAPRDDVVIGLDAPDDAAVVDTGGPELTVLTVDYFRAIIDDPYLFGKIAAVHALGDVYAMGGEPQTALAIATVPYGLEAKVEADLMLMMGGANEVLRDAGCALVGGHTSEGAELSLGFSVTGLVAREAALRKGGLQPGDALILTKPIGTGTLLAADMRMKAKARWVAAAVEHMTISNRAAAAILRRHGVHAATDVTGFGLLGHLLEMVQGIRRRCVARPSRPCRCSTARAKRWAGASSRPFSRRTFGCGARSAISRRRPSTRFTPSSSIRRRPAAFLPRCQRRKRRPASPIFAQAATPRLR